MSKINPAARLYHDMHEILKTLIIKYSYRADEYETQDVRSYAETYMNAVMKKDTYFTYQDYEMEEFRAVGVTDEGDIIAYTNSPELAPQQVRQAVLEYRRNRIITEYDEPNEYYRVLNGMPPIEDTDKDFIFVPEEFCNRYSIPKDLPIHLVEESLGKYYITLLESNGVINSLIKEYPDKEYLQHLGTRRVDTITARKAKNFSILYFDSRRLQESIHREFVRCYDKCRDYFMNTLYVYEYRNVIQYYDNFIALCIFLMTMQQVSARMISNAQDREYYDDYSIQLLYETYGVPFNKKIDELTQKQIVQNVNLLVQNKATDKVLLDISSILGFESIKIYEYYLMKERVFDSKGRPIFPKTKKWDDTINDYVVVPDYESMYDVHFQRVAIDEENLYKALQDPTNRAEYLDIITYDPFWWEDDDTYHEVWEREYNMIETKYLGTTIPYKLSEMLFQSVLQFHMIFDKSSEIEDIYIDLPKITDKKVRLFDSIILLCALLCKKYGIKGNIIATPSKILSLLEILDRDINREISKDTEILKFDFAAFDPDLIQNIREMRKEKVITKLTDEELRQLIEKSHNIIFKNPDGSFYSQSGLYFDKNGSRKEDVYRNPNTGIYYKRTGSEWYMYNENKELLDQTPKKIANILIEYNEGTVIRGNENDLRIEKLYEKYQEGQFEVLREYVANDSSLRESLVEDVNQALLSIEDVKYSDVLKQQILLENSEDFISLNTDEILVCTFPKRLYRYVKYYLESKLKEKSYDKYFEIAYEYDKTNGEWETEIIPDPLIPIIGNIELPEDESLEVFSVYIKPKSRMTYIKDLLNNLIIFNDKSYRIVDGHDIDLNADGTTNHMSYQKIREVIYDLHDLDKFYNHLIVLSAKTLGVTPEEKVESLNAIYENIRELYYFISFRISETTDYEEYYALKTMYDALFFTRETNQAFALKDKDGETFVPETFAEWLENKDLELYDFLNKTEKDSAYLYIDHIIYHLETILKHVDQLYVLNDGVSPLQELLIQLIQFFKSYTTDMVKFSSYMILDWKMENLIKFFDKVQYISKTDMIKDVLNLQYSDFINKYTVHLTLDDFLQLREKVSVQKETLPLEDFLPLSDEKYLWFNRNIPVFKVVKPFNIKGNHYEDGYFVVRYNYEDIYVDPKDETYFRKIDDVWFRHSKEGEVIRDTPYYFDHILDRYKKNELIISYAIEKKNGAIEFHETRDILDDVVVDYRLLEYDTIAEYFDSNNNRVPELDIPMSYNDTLYVIENGDQKGEYFTEDGKHYNKDGELISETDPLFMDYRMIARARKHVINFSSIVHSRLVVRDIIRSGLDKPDLYNVAKKNAANRPNFLSKSIVVKDGEPDSYGKYENLGNLHFFETVDIIHGPEEVYQFEDGSYYRFEARAYILYDNTGKRVSDKEVPLKDLQDKINNGTLVKVDKYI